MGRGGIGEGWGGRRGVGVSQGRDTGGRVWGGWREGWGEVGGLRRGRSWKRWDARWGVQKKKVKNKEGVKGRRRGGGKRIRGRGGREKVEVS